VPVKLRGHRRYRRLSKAGRAQLPQSEATTADILFSERVADHDRYKWGTVCRCRQYEGIKRVFTWAMVLSWYGAVERLGNAGGKLGEVPVVRADSSFVWGDCSLLGHSRARVRNTSTLSHTTPEPTYSLPPDTLTFERKFRRQDRLSTVTLRLDYTPADTLAVSATPTARC
jgi:hypothetical protein